MNRLYAGTSGELLPTSGPTWSELDLDQFNFDLVNLLNPGSRPRPLQVKALFKQHILDHRRNLIVSAPTNSGKSLLGMLTLLSAIRNGGRAVLVEPLRALAREKSDELNFLKAHLTQIFGRTVTVRLTTGDYRLEDEDFLDPPPAEGEIIITTPERFESIIRQPSSIDWLASIKAVCIDEAHLISSPYRGPTLEYLITSLLIQPAPPRLVLLSATLGDSNQALKWLSPCDLVKQVDRYPPLKKEILELSLLDDPDSVCLDFVRQALSDPQASVLIFVYQTRSASALSSFLKKNLSDLTGPDGPQAYHAQLNLTRREQVRNSYISGQSRCLITTSALALGVNLPATHVFIRDTTFHGTDTLSASDILQMMGRAGRGDRCGYAAALVRPNDNWKASELAAAIASEQLPAFSSFLEKLSQLSYRSRLNTSSIYHVVASQVAALFSRHPDTGLSFDEINAFFSRSFGGHDLVAHLPAALSWLTDPSRLLAYQTETGRYCLTTLGLKATRTVLPLPVAAGFAQLVRDLLTLDPSDDILSRWKPLDHLLVLHLLSDRLPSLRPFSEGLAAQIDGWMEQSTTNFSLLYQKWINGQSGASHASEVFGSLGISLPHYGRVGDDWARKQSYQALFNASLLFQRSMGQPIEDLERRWKIQNFSGTEERCRDTVIWLISGLTQILDLRCFYYHLIQECGADLDRIRRVKRLLTNMRHQTFELRERLKYCSPLGQVLSSLRSSPVTSKNQKIGVNSIRHLEDAGITTLADLSTLTIEELTSFGLQIKFARQLHNYVRHRLM